MTTITRRSLFGLAAGLAAVAVLPHPIALAADSEAADSEAVVRTAMAQSTAGTPAAKADAMRAALDAAGVRTRRVREIHLTGRGYGDHVWIEFFDAQQGRWRPADPTLSLVGETAWLRARLGFAARALVPVAIFAETDTGLESRATHYLVDGFARTEPSVRSSALWQSWIAEIDLLQPLAQSAFEGLLNLHAAEALFDALARTYAQLKETTP